MPNENTANDIRIGIDPEWDKVMSETLGDDWPAVLVLEHGMGCHEPPEYASVSFCDPCEERALGEPAS